MSVQLSQVGGIVEDHLKETHDSSYMKVEELQRNGDVGVVGGKFREKKISLWKFFIIEISLDDGSILSKKILSPNEYESKIKELTEQSAQHATQTGGTNTFEESSSDLGFKVQSGLTQGIMGFSLAMMVGLMIVGDYRGYSTVVIASYLGVALGGYYDMSVVKEYGIWKPFKPMWTIGLFLPGINLFIGLIYMIRRWSITP